eukprot:TRINITY_DN9964_c0_g1_i1.p1 TRINITY_DN9964_c0_g1~~TRINITY_DN9964_c0_g1_i1.p1  ORF type:complete len:457 (+),score=65.47 TRINITY_DN9964_c0_g1_i1:202-1371(+)
MGVVSKADEEHVHEVRALTDWRQSHGEEYGNTIKTQDFLPGNYSCFDSDGKLHVVKTFEQAISFIRQSWTEGKPLPLNPNWNVLLDQKWLPYVPTDSIKPLYNKEERDAAIMTRIANQTKAEWDLQSLSTAYNKIYRNEHVIEAWRGMPRTADGNKATELELWRTYVRFRDEWKVMQLFFKARMTLLFPMLYIHQRSKNPLTTPLNQKLSRAEEDARNLFRRNQNTAVMKVVKNLTHQKDMFAEKHGVTCTAFIDHIWDYLMVFEINHGFNESVGVAEVVHLHSISREKSTSDLSVSYKREKSVTSIEGGEGKRFTSGDVAAVDFMRRHGQRFLGLNPWVDHLPDPFAGRTRRVSRSALPEPSKVRPAAIYEHRSSLPAQPQASAFILR